MKSTLPQRDSASWSTDIVQGGRHAWTFDLGPGYLGPPLLPVDLLRSAYESAFDRFDSAALTYGADPGALPLRQALASRLSETDGVHCDPDEVVITAGTTQALALLSTSIATPGDIVLVAAETYDLARLIFVDAGLTVVSVAVDADGVVPEQLTRQIAETRRAGGTLAFVYLTPTFANPTGIVYPADRRRELLNVARDHSVTIVEDDAYADTGFEGAQPTTMSGLAGRKGVIRLGSFSKSLGPGLRLGWMVADREVALETTARGSFVSGGCVNHTTSLAVLSVLDCQYEDHRGELQTALRARRNALVDSLSGRLGSTLELSVPSGGFFLWVGIAGATDEDSLIDAAAAAGIGVAPGSRYTGRTTSATPRIRLSYSYNDPASLAQAGHTLAEAWLPLSTKGRS
ncbi:MAG: PLP-dependent aminotransferase family protein [Rhodococcus sp. (in: high G+C Gram-positive bacteria)]|uniref:aminotransferase-like domain-containing protein n=1 Tax=Rhodococcus sp. EPR-157 TaxID=1813677 RepID=UPI0007BC113E|nr:PLP-dependent aminotransferase family protein [Rhodococcus sp. EPR-157]KZF03685.1 hypothetical protein A2J03_07195 [Rhodococcus sp. EPR-157]